MKRFCRICEQPTVDDSMFCGRHRAQAALFTTAFAPPEGAAPAPPEEKAESSLPELASLRAAVDEALQRILARPQAGRDPEIAVYYLNNVLRARPFYAFASFEARAKPAAFALSAPWVQSALKNGGVLYEALARSFVERMEELRGQRIQLISLELCTFANEARLSVRPASLPKQTLKTFAVRGDTFVNV